MKIMNKAQMWFMDFVIATAIFSLVLISYYTYTTNISKQDTAIRDDLISDAKTIASSFTTNGYPSNWNSNNVIRIGFTDSNNRLNTTRFSEFTEINYTKSKRLLGIISDYFLFFANESGDVQNVEGFCGTGIGEVNISYEVSAAYYYQGPDDVDQFLRDFMVNKFGAEVYCDTGKNGCTDPNIDALISNINDYGIIVLEGSEFSGGDYGDFKEAVEPWVQAGGLLMISGELVSGQLKPMVGAQFRKNAGLSSSEEPATVINEDEFLAFNLRDQIVFDQAYSAEEDASISPPAVDFIDIARFNCTGPGTCDIEFEDILDNAIAISRWLYGDGKVFFFSDFDVEYFAGDFQAILEASTTKWVGAICLPINIDNINRDNLVKVERLLVYNSDPIKMILYMWQ